MSSYFDRAQLFINGSKSPYYQILTDIDPENRLDNDQRAIMALILDKAQGQHKIELYKIKDYAEKVALAQSLMPGGFIHSRQVLVQLWLQSRLEHYVKIDGLGHYEDI